MMGAYQVYLELQKQAAEQQQPDSGVSPLATTLGAAAVGGVAGPVLGFKGINQAANAAIAGPEHAAFRGIITEMDNHVRTGKGRPLQTLENELMKHPDSIRKSTRAGLRALGSRAGLGAAAGGALGLGGAMLWNRHNAGEK